MAGAGYKLFNTGDVLTAAQVNTYLMEQTVMVFADAAARTTALTGVVSEGMLSYLKSTKQVEVYNGSAWVASDDPNAIQNTIVDAKGDLITATASDVPARLAVGNNGETLVADSSATTGLRWSAQPSASNPVVNSAMDIWQRGTSFSVAASTTAYTADRWQVKTNTNQATTVSRQTTSDTTNLPFIQYAVRVQRNSGQTGTGNLTFSQSMETVNSIPYAGKTVTMSFYARRGANFSASGNNIQALLVTGTGTDQNVDVGGFTNGTNAIFANATLTTTWQRFTFTATLGATITQIAPYFLFAPTGTAGANDWYEVTGVQLDIGNVALPFRRSGDTLAGELAACQRYYQIIVSGDAKTVVNTAAYDSNSIYGVYRTVVSMRTAPTLSIVSGTGYYKFWGNSNGGVNASSFSLDSASEQGARFTIGGIAVTAGYAYWIMSANASAFAALQAEL